MIPMIPITGKSFGIKIRKTKEKITREEVEAIFPEKTENEKNIILYSIMRNGAFSIYGGNFCRRNSNYAGYIVV